MIYIISDGSLFVKIGKADDVDKRIKTLQCGNPNQLLCLMQIKVYDTKKIVDPDIHLEQSLHRFYANHRVYLNDGTPTEWFDIDVYFDLKRKTEFEIMDLCQIQPQEITVRHLHSLQDATAGKAFGNVMPKMGCVNNRKHSVLSKLKEELEIDFEGYTTPGKLKSLAANMNIDFAKFRNVLVQVGAEEQQGNWIRYWNCKIIEALSKYETREQLIKIME